MELDKNQLNIHRIWFNEDQTLPDDLKLENQKLAADQMEFVVKHWDINTLESFLQAQSAKVYPLYDKLDKNLKYHFMKNYIIYKYGGFFIGYEYNILKGKLISTIVKDNLMSLKNDTKAIFFNQKSSISDLYRGFAHCNTFGILNSNLFFAKRGHILFKTMMGKILTLGNKENPDDYSDFDSYINFVAADYLLSSEFKTFKKSAYFEKFPSVILPWSKFFILGSPRITSFLQKSVSKSKSDKPILIDKSKYLHSKVEWQLIEDIKNIANPDVDAKDKFITVVTVLMGLLIIISSITMAVYFTMNFIKRRKEEKKEKN